MSHVDYTRPSRTLDHDQFAKSPYVGEHLRDHGRTKIGWVEIHYRPADTAPLYILRSMTTCVILRDNSPEACSQWNGFLRGLPKTSNFYQRFEWKAINEREFGHETFYLRIHDGNDTLGVLPLVFLKSRIFGRIICSMPFVNFGGTAAVSPAVETALVERACGITADVGADYLEIRTTRPSIAGLKTSEHKVSMTLTLDDDPERIWNAFKSKHRTSIRRVLKRNIRVVSGREDLLDTFYELMCLSWRFLGTPIFRKSYFKRILDTFGDDIRIFIAYHGTRPVATAFNGHFGTTVEGMWAGGLAEARILEANYALYWEMIRDACERGFHTYHLGRSTADTGSESFKKKWNADVTQLYWQYFLPRQGDLPQLNVHNPKFDLAIRTWRRLPLWVTKTAGPLISRSIP